MKPRLAVVARVDVLRKCIENSIFFVRVGRLSAHESRPHPFGLMAFGLLVSSTALAQQSPTRGTALFVIRTPQEIVAAADSRVVNIQPGLPAPPPICKIRPFGAAFVAVNGVITDPRSGYAAYAVIEQAAKVQGDLPSRIKAFEGLVKNPLEKMIKRGETVVNERYSATPLTVTFFGIEGAELVFYKRRFPISGEGVSIDREQCPGDCLGGGGVVYVQPPKTNFYMNLTQEFPNFDRSRFDLGEVARRFVQMQINADVPDVGPPIDVLRITKDRTCWEECKNDCKADIPKCSDIKPTPTKTRQGLALSYNSPPAVLILGILAVSASLIYLFVRRR